MTRLRRLLLALFALCAAPAVAQTDGETIVAGLSQNLVSITADFVGSEILVYGAVKREAPEPDGPPLEVIVTVQGPSVPQIIRRKDRVAGIWINNSQVRIDSAPTFYALTSTGPMDDVLNATENVRHKILIPNAIRAVGISAEAEDSAGFVDALVRLRSADGTYRSSPGAVMLSDATLFRADVALPANLTEGNYEVRIFLTRGGRVVAKHEQVIGVRKAGLERLLHGLANEEPLTTGVLAILIAALAGWAASTAFRLLRL